MCISAAKKREKKKKKRKKNPVEKLRICRHVVAIEESRNCRILWERRKNPHQAASARGRGRGKENTRGKKINGEGGGRRGRGGREADESVLEDEEYSIGGFGNNMK